MAELWHRQAGEHQAAWDAFCHYRDMPRGGRTVDGAFRIHREACRKLRPDDGAGAPGLWWQWHRRFVWQVRADAYDAELEKSAHAKRLREVAAMHDRHAALATAFLNRVVERIQGIDPNTLTLNDLVKWLDRATRVERQARGRETRDGRPVGAPAGVPAPGTGDGLDLTLLTDEELDTFYRLLEKATPETAAGTTQLDAERDEQGDGIPDDEPDET